MLDDLGLIPALNAYLEDFTERSGIPCKFRAFPQIENLNNEEKTVLYRITQEALVNVIRHSKAHHVSLTIQRRMGLISMKIHDDGIGFVVNKDALWSHNKNLGLLGMRERAEMIGGEFLITSSPNKGTSIRLNLKPSSSQKETEQTPQP